MVWHASSVAFNGRAVVMKGASGTGKSSLALQLMALGGTLIADDQTLVLRGADCIWAKKPRTLPALIEARGLGLLPTALAEPTPVALILDMDTVETARLPDKHMMTVFGHDITVLRKVNAPHFPAAIIHYINNGRSEV